MDELEEVAAQMRREIEPRLRTDRSCARFGSRCWRRRTRIVEKKANTPTTYGPCRH
jgi:hypothetical protein